MKLLVTAYILVPFADVMYTPPSPFSTFIMIWSPFLADIMFSVAIYGPEIRLSGRHFRPSLLDAIGFRGLYYTIWAVAIVRDRRKWVENTRSNWVFRILAHP